MQRSWIIIVLPFLCLGMRAAAAEEPAAAPAPEPAPAVDRDQLTYDVQQLPVINSLDLTREQIAGLLAIAQAALTERERIAKETPSEDAVAPLEAIRDQFLRGGLQDTESQALRKKADELLGGQQPTAQMRRLAQQLVALLSREQITILADPEAAEQRAQQAAKAAADALVALRRLPDDAYPAQRDQLIASILDPRYQAGTPDYEQARQGLVNALDYIRALTEEQFLEQRDRLGSQFARRWGDIPAVASNDRGWRGGRWGGPPGRGNVEDPVAALESLRGADDREYGRRRDDLVRYAVRRRMAADPNADFRELATEIAGQLDQIRNMPQLQFEQQKATLVQSVFATSDTTAGSDAAANDIGTLALKALERLGDAKMVKLLTEKAKYLQPAL
jgi:hypothetical protein